MSQRDPSVVVVDHNPVDPAGESLGDGDPPFDAEHLAGMDRERDDDRQPQRWRIQLTLSEGHHAIIGGGCFMVPTELLNRLVMVCPVEMIIA